MLKKTDDLLKVLNFKNQKQDFDSDVRNVLNIIKKESGVVLQNKDIFVKKNVFKIKTSSNIKFLILLHLYKINEEVNKFNNTFIVEL